VVLEEQIQPGTFEFALDRLVDTELDLSALDAKFNNDEVGASAYDPRVMLKIVLLGYSRGLISSRRMERFEAKHDDCQACDLRGQCLRNPKAKRGRQVAKFEARKATPDHPSERMRQAIDSSEGRQLYSQRIATVEPVFANIRHHKKMDRFTLRGKLKVGIQWLLYCLVHNIEKMAAKTAHAG
jgi:Transposase DDE domain/Transposase domain (DUF772)